MTTDTETTTHESDHLRMTPDDQSPPQAPQVLLIDLENCPSQIEQLLKNVQDFAQVVLCYAQTGAKIPLDWLVPLSATVQQQQLKIIKMTRSGKNGSCKFSCDQCNEVSPHDTVGALRSTS